MLKFYSKYFYPKQNTLRTFSINFRGDVYSVGFFESKKLFEGVPYFEKKYYFGSSFHYFFYSVVSINIQQLYIQHTEHKYD